MIQRNTIKNLVSSLIRKFKLAPVIIGCIDSNLIILTYHSFTADSGRFLYHRTLISTFERQLQYFLRYFKIVSLSDALEQRYNRKYSLEIEKKPQLVLTVDDGFEDNYLLMFPLLKKYGVSATFFISTDFVDNKRPPWMNQIIDIVDSTNCDKIRSPIKHNLTTVRDKAYVVRKLKNLWKSLRPEDRFIEIRALRERLKVAMNAASKPMAWHQLREMKKSNMDIGSHSVYHSILPEMSEDVVKYEVIQSKCRIESELQVECRAFSYPNGNWNILVMKCLKESGYKYAVTQDIGNNSIIDNQLRLERIEIPYNDSLETCILRLGFARFYYA